MGNIEIILGGRARAGDTGEKVVEQFGARGRGDCGLGARKLAFPKRRSGAQTRTEIKAFADHRAAEF
jgi:hypothetical protein